MQLDTIIVPTDFSACSHNAVNFATTIAEVFYSKLVLINVSSTHEKKPESKRYQSLELKKKQAQLNDLKLEILQKNALLNVTTVLLEGENAEPVLKLSEKDDADLVILGAKGDGGIKDVLVGSFASELIEKSSCPVLAVPEQTNKAKFKRIVYASDLEHIDIAAIKELTTFANYYNAEVTILNISDQKRRFTEEQLFNFEKQVRENCSYPKLDFIYFHGSDINYHIQEYLQRNKADLLVITTIKESLVTNMFQNRMTPKLAYHSSIPLLTFHESDKCCQSVTTI